MPRIRSIKPQFWEDEKISKLSVFARLMFIGLWNYADDEGILIWRAELIRSKIFPYDNFPIEDIYKLQDELVNNNLLYPYKNQNDSYAVILNFRKHQVINRPQPSQLPTPDAINDLKYKEAIFKRDHYICHFCGRLCITTCKEDSLKTEASLDLIIPKSKGGKDYPSNIITFCCSCNKSKGSKSYDEFIELMRGQGYIIDDSLNTPTPNNDESLGEKEGNKDKGVRSKEGDTRFTFGEFKNVLLSNSEHEKLITKFGELKCNELIEQLSSGIKSKGYKYKDFYATILNWARRDGNNGAHQENNQWNGKAKQKSNKDFKKGRYASKVVQSGGGIGE
jgi:hypothetical protein